MTEQYDQLPDEALDGWLGKVCRERLSEFPRAAAWLALVTAASIHVPGANRCNLYTVLVGRAGDGKSEISNRAMWLMSADEQPQCETVAPGSGEGLIRVFKQAKRGKRLLYQDELADMMGKSRIEGSSLGQKLSELWSTDRIGTACKGVKDSVETEVRLSILGNLVIDRFDEAFHSGTVLGFYRRTLFGEYPSTFPPYLYRPIRGDRAYVPSIGNADDPTAAWMASERQPVSVEIADDVFDERDRWTRQEGIDPILAEPVLRVAIVCASFDGRPVLKACDLGPTLALLKYQASARQWLKPNLGENDEAILHNKIMDYLRRFASNGEPLKRRDLLKKTHAYERFGAPMVERVLRSLVSQQLIVMTDGKPSTGPRGKSETIALAEGEFLIVPKTVPMRATHTLQ